MKLFDPQEGAAVRVGRTATPMHPAVYNKKNLPWCDLNKMAMDHFAQAAQAVGLYNQIADINVIQENATINLLPWMSESGNAVSYKVIKGDTLNTICARYMSLAFYDLTRFMLMVSAYNSLSISGSNEDCFTEPTTIQFPYWTALEPMYVVAGTRHSDLYACAVDIYLNDADKFWCLVQMCNPLKIPYTCMYALSDPILAKITQLEMPSFYSQGLSPFMVGANIEASSSMSTKTEALKEMVHVAFKSQFQAVVPILHTSADVYRQQGKYEQALEDLNRVLDIKPDDVPALK